MSTIPSTFLTELRAKNPLHKQRPAPSRRWLYVPYDQLTDEMGPLAREAPSELGIVLIEAPAKAGRRPYHKQKLALVLTNMRHFALEQAARGVAIRYQVTTDNYATELERLHKEVGPIRMMEAAEYELRAELQPLSGSLQVLPHEGFLSTREDFSELKKPWRMDAFYRIVRRRTQILMDGEKPTGGKFSFDAENRLPWRGTPKVVAGPKFVPDAITREVADLISREFKSHPGTLNVDQLPASAEDAQALWRHFLEHGLAHFGPYEDAMSQESTKLFHSQISPLLNLGRVLPEQLVREVERADAPLASREGFIRQVLGWREFVRHVHIATDGFRSLSTTTGPTPKEVPAAAAAPSYLGAAAKLPPAFWGTPSGLSCLDTVIESVWREAMSHHITRLMVLSNLATLLAVSPRELTDWFWVAYQDAYDWVVEPNVLGMGTYAVGDLMTTKPYVSGAAYINKMSDYCTRCSFDPKKNCPITPMYWAFLNRNQESLQSNMRMKLPMASARKRPQEAQKRDARVFTEVSRLLAGGEQLTPEALERLLGEA
jgi:deoxyribodipyrimidine photolyase-related protein